MVGIDDIYWIVGNNMVKRIMNMELLKNKNLDNMFSSKIVLIRCKLLVLCK